MSKAKAKKKSLLPVLLITLASFIVSLLLLLSYPIQQLELKFRDQLFEWRGPLDVSHSPIVMVAMSEDADDEIPEKYPWPTSIYARLVENLNEAGAKAILFDVIFESQDMYDFKNDTLFAEAIQEHENVILAGDFRKQEGKFADEFVPIFPTPVLTTANPNPVGLVRVHQGLDGAVRSYMFGIKHGMSDYYMLGLEGLQLYSDIPKEDVEELGADYDNDFFHFGNYSILKDRQNSFLINYYGPEGTFPVISLEDVIDDADYNTVFESELEFEINVFDNEESGLLQKGLFKDKIVIVGSTMALLKDFYSTPFANKGNDQRPGYEIHAHAIQTILDENYISRQAGWVSLMFMFFFAVITGFINRWLKASWGAVFTVFTGGTYFYSAVLSFIHLNYLMMITGPLLVLFISQISMMGYEYYMEQKEKRRIKGMFSSYVSPELVDQMIQSGEEPQLGGEETFMTAFFSDIASFSTFSEQLEAKKLVQLINEYLNAMTNIINEQDGTLDKYIGDAIVAFYGAPVYLEDHAYKACLSSQLMEKELAELRKKWEKDGWPEIVYNMKQRMGMNTGMMVTGNMGSTRRFNYTMMGDDVNLAARCESAAKQYGIQTMVTESTKTEAEKYGAECIFRLLDFIVVKGRTKPVKVYEIAGLKSDAGQKLFDCTGLYEAGLEKYFQQEWDAAVELFQESAQLEVNEFNPSLLFIDRCRHFMKNPPGTDWNGVYIMTSK